MAATYQVQIDFESTSGSAAVFMGAGETTTTFATSQATATAQQLFATSINDEFGGDYDDVTRDVVDLLIRRGRDDTGGPFGPGECSMTLTRVADPLDAPSAPGGRELYNPASTDSPLSPQFDGTPGDKIEPGISPLRPMRVRMTVSGTTRTLFYGWITTWRYNRESGQARIQAKDVMWRLSRVRPSFTQNSGETTSSAIGRVLTEANWTDPTLRDLNRTIQGVAAGVGDTLATGSFSPDGETRTGLQLIDELLETNNGYFYQRGDVATFENRTARSLRVDADFTVSDVAFEFDPGFDVE